MYAWALVGIGSLLAVHAIWWTWKLRAESTKAMQDLPPANQLSWRLSRNTALARSTPSTSDIEKRTALTIEATMSPSPDGATADHKIEVPAVIKDPLTWAAAADGGIAGWSILESALKIDPQVLSAIEFSTADHIHNLADINSYVHGHFFSAPLQSADGWFNRLTGYVAEQKAASFFESTGHQVVFAPVANQPVWDLLVDGHPVQIKEHLAGAKDFALSHAGIPVFTDPNIAAIVKEQSVHGLSVLNKDSIHSAASGTIDGLDGTFDPGFHMPFITMAFSAYREAKLLFAEQTTFDRALLHVGMDVAGVGGGAVLGAKIGAFVGSILPGPGTIIGGIFGSLLGGISGKMASSSVRKLPFYNAREHYNTAVEAAQSEINTAIDDSRKKVHVLQREYQEKFSAFRHQIEAEAKEQIGAQRSKSEAEVLRLLEAFPEYLQELGRQLRSEEQEVLSGMPSPTFADILFTRENHIQRSAVKGWFRRARRIVQKEVRAFKKIEPRSLETLQTAFQQSLREFVFELDSLDGELARVNAEFEQRRQEAEHIGRQAVSKIEEHRQNLLFDFGKRVVELHESIVRNIKSWNNQISYKRDELRRQAAAVGITI